MTALVFLAVGMVKGHLLDEGMGRAGLQTLVTGSAAAVMASAVGHGLQAIVGVAQPPIPAAGGSAATSGCLWRSCALS